MRHLTCGSFVTKEIKADTGVIRDNTAAIKQDTTLILEEIAALKAQLPDNDATLIPNVQGPDARLAGYLDDLTSCAETVCWSGRDSDTEADPSVGDATPPESPIFQSSPRTRLPDTVPVFRDLIHDPFLTSKAKTSSPRPQHGTQTLVPPNPKPIGASSALAAQNQERDSSKHQITQRVMEKLQAQGEADSVHHLRQNQQLHGDALSRKMRRKSDREASLGAKIEPETQVEYRNTEKNKEPDAPRPGVADVPRINNPRLLATVEDAIKRLILPELNAMKAGRRRKLSGLNQMKAEEARRYRKMTGLDQEPKHDDINKSARSNPSARDAALAGLAAAELTAAALKQHTMLEDMHERRELRRRRAILPEETDKLAASMQTEEAPFGPIWHELGRYS
jgi:hypothetical protein